MNILKEFDNKFLCSGVNLIAGVDEVGRGPLAGPVVAAAVIFDGKAFISGVNDSKKVKEKERPILADQIKEHAITYAYGFVSQSEIDNINILQATLKAMKIAVSELRINPDLILIDGNKTFVSNIQTRTVVKGDSKSFSMAAASILAKVKRDEFMKEAALKYPQFAWHKNKGYGTAEHIAAIKKHGITPFHRKSFLRNLIDKSTQGVLL